MLCGSDQKLLNRLRERFYSTAKYRGRLYRYGTVILPKVQELAKHILDKTTVDLA